jgi:hypothetical protein
MVSEFGFVWVYCSVWEGWGEGKDIHMDNILRVLLSIFFFNGKNTLLAFSTIASRTFSKFSPRTSAIFFTTSSTQAGSFRLPRYDCDYCVSPKKSKLCGTLAQLMAHACCILVGCTPSLLFCCERFQDSHIITIKTAAPILRLGRDLAQG